MEVTFLQTETTCARSIVAFWICVVLPPRKEPAQSPRVSEGISSLFPPRPPRCDGRIAISLHYKDPRRDRAKKARRNRRKLWKLPLWRAEDNAKWIDVSFQETSTFNLSFLLLYWRNYVHNTFLLFHCLRQKKESDVVAVIFVPCKGELAQKALFLPSTFGTPASLPR